MRHYFQPEEGRNFVQYYSVFINNLLVSARPSLLKGVWPELSTVQCTDMFSNFTYTLEDDHCVKNFQASMTHFSCLIQSHLRLNILRDADMFKF